MAGAGRAGEVQLQRIALARAKVRKRVWGLLEARKDGFPWITVNGRALEGWTVLDSDATPVACASEKEGAAGTETLALDGKSARGSRLGATPAAHLLAAMTGTGMTVTQLRVPGKTNEITCSAALLDPYDLQGVTVTGMPCTPSASTPASSSRRRRRTTPSR